jgi:hypothetical protein
MSETEAEVAENGDEEEEAPKPSKKQLAAMKLEKPRLIHNGTWVTLGQGDDIPEELRGHDACVIVAPMKNSDGDEQIPFAHQYQDDDTVFTVRTRDQYSAEIQAKREDFAVISDNGRSGLASAG